MRETGRYEPGERYRRPRCPATQCRYQPCLEGPAGSTGTGSGDPAFCSTPGSESTPFAGPGASLARARACAGPGSSRPARSGDDH